VRILKLRFKNLNSLAGEWKIDFEDTAFTSDGIFAITGPTGSGKSTILDAICLGLYGRTPRLNKITASENEVMARQTGDCFAEVVFSTQEGRYRSFWSQKRAGNRPEGNLQPPSHELSSEVSGTPLATGLRQVSDGIVQVTGMDFEHFTRAMLLAQGRFAEFLQSNASVRADLLEKITGTDLYSAISIHVHNRNKEEGTTLKVLQAEISGIEVLNEGTEIELRSEQAHAIKERETLNRDAEKNQGAITWLRTIESLNTEIIRFEQEERDLTIEVNAFAPEQDRLDRAQKAVALEGAFATLMEIRTRQADDRKSIEKEKSALPHEKEGLKRHGEELTASQNAKEEAKAVQAALRPVILKTRQLDQELSGLSKRIAELDREYQTDQKSTAEITTLTNGETAKRQQAESELALVQTYLEDHLKDEWLVTGLPAIRLKLETLEERQDDVQILEIQLASTVELKDEAQNRAVISGERLTQCQEAIESSSIQINKQTETLDQLLSGKLLREYQMERENLIQQRLLLQRIAQLEVHRRQLEDGSPCPLCGSLDHPYAEGNVPEPSSMDQAITALDALISQVETLNQAIARLREEHLVVQQNSFHAEKALGEAIKDQELSEKQLAQTEVTLSKQRAMIEDLKAKLMADLALLGTPELQNLAPMALLEALNHRLESWNDHQEAKAAIADRIALHDHEMVRLKAISTTLSEGLIAKDAKLKDLKDQSSGLQKERQALFDDRLPDQEEQLLNDSIVACENREKESREGHDRQRDLVTTIKARLITLEKRIAEVEPRRIKEEATFAAKLGPQGFTDETAFLAARISGSDLETLDAQSKSIKERIADLNTRLKDRRHRLLSRSLLLNPS
jgi:DNA repair protein SbcC/Rad50